MKKRDERALRQRQRDGRRLAGVVRLFYFSAFLLLALKDYAWQGFALALAVPAMISVGTNLLPRLFPVDKLLMSLANFLCALGVLVLYATNPEYAYQQAMNYGVGLIAMVVCIYVVRLVRRWHGLVLLMMPASLALLALPLAIGQETFGAKNWFYVAGISVQPSEIVKLSLLIVLSFYMSRRRMLMWLCYAAACLGLLMLQKDLGTALMYYGVTLMLYYASTSNLFLTGVGLMGGAGAAVVGYHMFSHVKKRVAIWQNPWSDFEGDGYQIIQGLMAIASGGFLGVGLGLGSPTIIPVYHTDFIFAVICEQFGLVFGLFVLAMYVALIWRGASIAMSARKSFHGLLAMGCTALIALQTFTIIGGVLKLIPLTGVTMPFVSYGGTSMVSSLAMMGLLQGVASLNEADLDEDTRLAMLGSQEGAV